jgi:hypothetical protein
MERKRDKDDTKKEEGAKDATEDVEEEIIDENDDLLADLDEE